MRHFFAVLAFLCIVAFCTATMNEIARASPGSVQAVVFSVAPGDALRSLGRVPDAQVTGVWLDGRVIGVHTISSRGLDVLGGLVIRFPESDVPVVPACL